MKRFFKVRHIISAVVILLVSYTASARVYKLEGTIGDTYSIVIELEEFNDGLFSGRYAYKSTLQRNGNLDCSWLDIHPSHDNPVSSWSIRDCKLNPVETWYNVKFTDGRRLTCKMKNAKGKVYDIVANVIQSSPESPSTKDYFKSHIGESASDFGLFFDPSIQQRLEDMMGVNNFNYMTYIYQTQGGIEYIKGMYYGSGYKAHECCDPAAIWAYDTDNDVFYVWIRKDDKEYCWSESGNIPYKFRELADSIFGF